MQPLQVDMVSSSIDGKVRTWTVLSCPRCARVVVFETNAKDKQPPAILGTIPESTDEVGVSHLPDDVAAYYRQANRVLDVGVPDAAAVQLRKTLEAASAHFNVTKGSLLNRIRQLANEGLITAQFKEALDYIREIGNVGAHAGDESVDEETVRRALRFTTQALRNLFEIPAELEALKNEGGEDEEGSGKEEPTA